MTYLIAASQLTDLALAIGMMLLAIALLFAEVLLPSFGLLTITALVCGGFAIHTAFSVSAAVGAVFVVVTVLSLPAFLYLALSVAKRTPLILRDEAETVPAVSGESLGLAVGDKGVALTPLRPGGTARFGGRRVDVVTRGEAVDSGEQVEVLKIDGFRTVVKAVVA